MPSFPQDPPALPPLAEAQQFLLLLDDVKTIQNLLLDEAARLRTQVTELQAKVDAAQSRGDAAQGQP